MDDNHLMAEAIVQARLAQSHGDVPVGAVVARNGVIIATGRNQRELVGDPTAHAEVVALRAAAATIGHWRLAGCDLVVTLEPCAMCAGALVLARVDRLVFGATDPKAGAVRSLMTIADDSRLNHRADVVGGVRKEECGLLLKEFFAARR